jgi:hypothetical protein
MAEVLVRYVAEVVGPGGVRYIPQACGGIADDGLWEGWIEFIGGGSAIRTGRETEQPNRDALMYWAQGLTGTYLEGALSRATTPVPAVVTSEPTVPSIFDGAAPPPSPRGLRPSRAILDPFSTYDQGEDLLRRQLHALSHDNLVAIVEDYGLPIYGTSDMRSRRLVEEIVEAVKVRSADWRNAGSPDANVRNSVNPSIHQPDDPAR